MPCNIIAQLKLSGNSLFYGTLEDSCIVDTVDNVDEVKVK
jgi:hypothetical protein